MMFVSLGIGTVLAVALIVVVSVLTGGTVKGAGAPAPALVGKTLAPWSQAGLNGKTVAAPWDLGHPTVVVVFASWCGPCQAELPALSKYLTTHSLGKVSLLGVDVQDTPARATAFLQRVHLTMTSISDPQASVYGRFLLPGVPDTIFVNAQGVVQNMTIGAISPAKFAAGVAALNA
ncbi:MAG: TlpA disulfide reductase family protein [Actinomycetota bacterium]|jgi:cytochrome c biogenesis protein CcmG/thiol:disulfide interchange protein DsbE|nr:TlpA disulfide reductase family protein [Actinomycetota bacterium]